MDGAVYEWNIGTQKREGESVLKSCSYTCVAVSPDGKTVFAVGSDRTLKEITDGQVSFISYAFIDQCSLLIGKCKPILMTMSPFYPCGKPCSARTRNETVKKQILFSAIINGI